MRRSLHALTGRRVTQVALVAIAGVALAACSSGGSSTGSTTTTNSTNTGSSTTSASSTPTTSSAGGSVASKLQALMQSTQAVKGRTLALTYTESSSTSGAGAKTLTFAQDPPKYLFEVSSAILVDTGTATYACSNTGSGADYCESSGATTTALAPLLNLITGQTVSSSLQSVRAGVLAKLAGVHASFSNASFAGQSSTCVSGSQGANTFKYCLTDSGVLAYAGGSNTTTFGSLTLISYSTSPPASDFTVPKGATVVTTP
jgi:hypothetical protein